MLAVIKTGGKQYLVKEGDELKIEKVNTEKDGGISFEVLLLADEDGKKFELGNPVLSGVSVHANVLEHGRGKKVTIIKFKPKVRYRRKIGHRQPYSKIKVSGI